MDEEIRKRTKFTDWNRWVNKEKFGRNWPTDDLWPCILGELVAMATKRTGETSSWSQPTAVDFQIEKADRRTWGAGTQQSSFSPEETVVLDTAKIAFRSCMAWPVSDRTEPAPRPEIHRPHLLACCMSLFPMPNGRTSVADSKITWPLSHFHASLITIQHLSSAGWTRWPTRSN